jgi:Sulfotransferase family
MNHQLVGLHGAPRSGTSWLGQLFNSHEQVAYRFQPFFSHAFRGRIDTCSAADEMDRLFDDLLQTGDPFVTQSGEARLARDAPNFGKAPPTHLVYKEVRFHDLIEPILLRVPRSRMIGIVRDPLQVIESWVAAPREFMPGWSIASEWRNAQSKNAGLPENWYGFERWKALARLFVRLERDFPGRFTIVRYADLVRDTAGWVERLFQFAGLSPTRQTMQFIGDSTARDDGDPYGVYRAGRRDRDRPLPDEIRETICRDLENSDLARFMTERA